jgi:cyclic pyranopterin monophosphate synthase
MPEPSGQSTHFNSAGDAQMVDVSTKPLTVRTATAAGSIKMQPATAAVIRGGTAAKGDVLAIARVAAITATKLTPLLIPLCHAIAIEGVEVRFRFDGDVTLTCEVDVRTSGKTGVEMEAMTAVTTACLTIYDMCKSIDRSMTISEIRLLRKDGGASGSYLADSNSQL